MARAIAWDKDRFWIPSVQSEKYETGAAPALKFLIVALTLIS
jgi:hypothetical protein